ncbi:DUF4231 domain-containing protein [Fibrella sp. HMF5335]|uniref:DUF4231 domain-containing protein n=1 Tax=Fibrella rubiginis TaxID=2817060 RepID=A0A939GG31_9BACT|nr:DUF4231 domain-containing protein [Fibrella rubiginis]MBO0936081.1 DUF4231 domain-containing protein [Fibrella rubiginis]
MTTEDYITSRVETQIAWYNQNASLNKKLHFFFKISEIFLAVSIPILTVIKYNDIIIAVCGGAISIFASLSSILRPNEKWKQYRSTSEIINNEKFLFLSSSRQYSNQGSYQLFVDKIESIILKENLQWRQIIVNHEEKKNNR